MAVVLGAANAYLGMKAGLTVSATFPAAVVAMAALRPFRGTILEENIARTAASVGEALVAGAIFTIPAFVIAGAWTELHYWESTVIMLIGGVLGVLFIIVLRRPLVVDSDLPVSRERRRSRDPQSGPVEARPVRVSCSARWRSGPLGALQELERDSPRRRLHQPVPSFQPFDYPDRRRGDLLSRRTVPGGPYGVSCAHGGWLHHRSAYLRGGLRRRGNGLVLLVPLALFLNPSFGSGVGSRPRGRGLAAAGPSLGGGHHDRRRLSDSVQSRKAAHRRNRQGHPERGSAGRDGSNRRRHLAWKDRGWCRRRLGSDLSSLLLLLRLARGRSSSHCGHGHPRVSLLGGRRIPRRSHRRIQQPDLGAHALGASDCRRAHGRSRANRHQGRGRRCWESRESSAAPPESRAT